MRALKLVEQIAEPEIAEVGSWDGRLQMALLAPNGVKKLRELILELAIRGQLVPQKNEEEGVAELLNRKEKDAYDAFELFSVPQNWTWLTLNETGDIFNGNSINETTKANKYTGLKDGYPFIATKDVGYGSLDLNYENGVKIPKSEEKFKVAHKSAVLICSEGGSAGKKIGLTDRDICFGNKLYANEVRDYIDSKYIFYVYQSGTFYSQFKERMTGIIGGISLNQFKSIPVPIPPLSEQNRIVSKINELMALCDTLEAQKSEAAHAHERLVKTLLDTLMQSQGAKEFQENWERIAKNFNILFTTEASVDALKENILQLAVTGKLVPQSKKEISVENEIIEFSKHNKNKSKAEFVEDQNTEGLPENWCLTAFANIISLINYGTSKKCIPDPTKTPVFRIPNILNGKIDHCDLKHACFSKTELKKLALEAGDILIIRSNGSLSLVGQAAVVEEKDIKSLYAGYLIRIRALKSIIYPRFLTLQLSSPNMRKKIESFGRSTSGVNNINSRQIASLNIYVPPLEEQKRIVSKVDELISICDSLKDRLSKLNSIHEQLALALVEKAAAE
ncbi:MAG: restriction endonuclease subunit S [Micavibrio sp.]|nr:restriction endonuclease subunit S [Micavibrio sp.]